MQEFVLTLRDVWSGVFVYDPIDAKDVYHALTEVREYELDDGTFEFVSLMTRDEWNRVEDMRVSNALLRD